MRATEQGVIAARLGKLRIALLKQTDRRVKLVNEALQGIRYGVHARPPLGRTVRPPTPKPTPPPSAAGANRPAHPRPRAPSMSQGHQVLRVGEQL